MIGVEAVTPIQTKHLVEALFKVVNGCYVDNDRSNKLDKEIIQALGRVAGRLVSQLDGDRGSNMLTLLHAINDGLEK